jgi:hypothetical protein
VTTYQALDDHVRQHGTRKPLVQTFLALRNELGKAHVEIAKLQQVVANQEKRLRDLESGQPAQLLPPA